MAELLPGNLINREKEMIYIVLPAFNEEKTLPKLLEEIGDHMEESRIPYQIIIVNDGSSDGTMEAIRNAMTIMPILCLEHPHNLGLSEAMKTGLFEAQRAASPRDIIITMDSDNTHTPGLIIRMVRLVREGHDVVVGSRYQAGARVIGVPTYRKLLSFSASLIFRILFPIKGVKDYTSGYRAYRAKVIKDMFEVYGDEFIDRPGFSCMVDILLKIRKFPAIIGEAPLILRYDLKQSESKMNVAKTVYETFALITKRLLEG